MTLGASSLVGLSGCGQPDPEPCTTPEECYQLVTVEIPDGIELEIGGLVAHEDHSLSVATRRGEVWRIEGAYDTVGTAGYTRFAEGLHEPLGLAWKDGAYYTSQRAELTRLVDTDSDGRADVYETVYPYPITGNYHEYAYGPEILPDGSFYVTLNLGWVGYGNSPVPWRGWALNISPDGAMTPIAAGMRSPAGIGVLRNGDMFYAENQGDWIGSGYITHIEPGDFGGHPNSLAWSDLPGSPVKLTMNDIPDTGEPRHVVGSDVPAFKLPTAWFPHTLMGISTAGILEDVTGGGFGPFDGQLFVGDQGHSKIMRVFLDSVDGVYQGMVFPFYEGLDSGPLRLAWGTDHSLWVGQTSRGWAATGTEPFALQRLVWTGRPSFEMKAVRATESGFEVEFTDRVDLVAAVSTSNYDVTGFTYKYHSTYGSPIVNSLVHEVSEASVSNDGLIVSLSVGGLRAGYIHEIRLDSGIVSATGTPLLHNYGFYTLNRIPGGRQTTAGAGMTETAAPETSAKRVNVVPPDWTDGPDATLTVSTLPGLRFDKEELRVRPGSNVQLTFENADDMLHNLVVTSPDAADDVADAAIALGLAGQSRAFVPDDSDVLAHTGLLQPETSESIYFTAPTVPGRYAFVCTFPGHARTMRGVLIVGNSSEVAS